MVIDGFNVYFITSFKQNTLIMLHKLLYLWLILFFFAIIDLILTNSGVSCLVEKLIKNF